MSYSRKIDVTAQVQEFRKAFDRELTKKITRIAALAGVEEDQLVKINPMDFLELTERQFCEGYTPQKLTEYIEAKKNDHVYLISPLDADNETANQIRHKEGNDDTRLRASKCTVLPIPSPTARAFLIRNHRQSLPNISTKAICFGLVYDSELVAIMIYDYFGDDNGVRGKKNMFELLRLAIKSGYMVNGGASRLQKRCEEALRGIGETEIFSYSNATINSGKVYDVLGFERGKIQTGKAYVIYPNGYITPLVSLSKGGDGAGNKTIEEGGMLKFHVGGNRMHIKQI